MRTVALAVFCLAISPSLHAQKPIITQESRFHYRLGWEDLQHEAWEEALGEFQKSVEIDPAFALGYYGEGRALMALKRYVEAIQAYTRCRDLYRDESGKLFTNQIEAQHRRREATEQIREEIRLYSSGPQTARTAEMIRQLQNRLRTIEQNQDYGQNISLEQMVPPFVMLALGSAYFRADRLQEAEREYLDAISAKPDYGEAHNNLAVVYLYTHRPADALKHVQLAEKAGYRVSPDLKDEIKEANRTSG